MLADCCRKFADILGQPLEVSGDACRTMARILSTYLGGLLLFSLLDPKQLVAGAGAEQQAACGVTFKIPKVALMFLSRAGMPLSPVWSHW